MGKTAASTLERFQASKLYVITAPRADLSYERMVEAACLGGADVVQFRDKQMSHKECYEVAARLRAICQEHRVLFIVNDLLEVALASQADGVHLGQDDLPTAVARDIVRQMGVKEFLIGRSTHSLEQAKAAEREGADYIGIGPVFATPTKPSYGAVGLELVRAVTSQVQTPHVAIGGIDQANVVRVLEAGADRVAVVRAVANAKDVAESTRVLKTLVLSSPAASSRGSKLTFNVDSPLTSAGNDVRGER